MNKKTKQQEIKLKTLSPEEQNKLRGGSPPRMIIPRNPDDGG